MNKEERLALYKRSTAKWGVQAQIDQIIEEMAELIVALNKYKRCKFYNEKRNEVAMMQNLFVELADVTICLEQMTSIFGETEIERVRDLQLDKFLKEVEKA